MELSARWLQVRGRPVAEVRREMLQAATGAPGAPTAQEVELFLNIVGDLETDPAPNVGPLAAVAEEPKVQPVEAGLEWFQQLPKGGPEGLGIAVKAA